MAKVTVVLYYGSINHILNIVAVKKKRISRIEKYDYISVFYDKITTNNEERCRYYKNKLTDKSFPVYYERYVKINNDVMVIDFGSYMKFIAVIDKKIKKTDLYNIFDKENN